MQCLSIRSVLTFLIGFVVAAQAQAHEQIKVLIPSLLNGSWERLSLDVAYELANDENNKYNVTLICASDLDVKLNDNLNLIRLPYTRNELLPMDLGDELVNVLGKLEQMKTEYFFKNNYKFVKDLQNMNFDVCFATTFISEGLVCRVLEINTFRHFSALPDPMVSIANREPNKNSYNQLVMQPNQWFTKTFDQDSIVQRLAKMGARYFFKNHAQNIDNYGHYLADYYRTFRFKMEDQLIVGFGVEGLSDVVPHGPNVIQWNPLTSKGSKFANAQSLSEIPAEYEEHLNKYNQTILIAFGTTWAPDIKAVKKILATVEQMPNHGFIMGLKDSISYYDYVMEIEKTLPNLMIRSFIPQQKLLNDQRVTVFMTHCGMNSMLEAAYFGKPVFGMPIAIDQFAMCQRAQDMDIGYHFDETHKSQTIVKQLTRMADPESSSYKNAQKISRILEFEETRGGEDLKYWIDYAAKHGIDHMQQFRIGDTDMFDLDIIKFDIYIVLTAIVVTYLTFKYVLVNPFKKNEDQ